MSHKLFTDSELLGLKRFKERGSKMKDNKIHHKFKNSCIYFHTCVQAKEPLCMDSNCVLNRSI